MEHRIERDMLAGLPGEKIAYSSWTEQLAALGEPDCAGMKRVAMQYSPMCAIPYVVDGGRGHGGTGAQPGRGGGHLRRADPDLRGALDAGGAGDRIWKPGAAWTGSAPRRSR